MISTGDAGPDATVVVARNVFWNIDHAINLKNKNATIFENNTVVQVHDDFVDGGGALNVGSALNFFVDEPGAVARRTGHFHTALLLEVSQGPEDRIVFRHAGHHEPEPQVGQRAKRVPRRCNDILR